MHRRWSIPIQIRSVAETRAAALHEILPADIQHMGRHELEHLREWMHLGENWNVIEIPREWLPPGGLRTQNRIRIREKLSGATSKRDELQLALLQVNRYLLLCLLMPAASVKGKRLLSITSVIRCVEGFTALMSLALAKEPISPNCLLDRMTIEEAMASSMTRLQKAELGRLERFAYAGLWHDVLADPGLIQVVVETQEGEPVHRPYMPLPDEFVAEAGWRLSWVVENLGSALVQFAHQVAEMMQHYRVRYKQELSRTKKAGPKLKQPSSLVKRQLREFEWRTPDGKLIDSIPFARREGSGIDLEWPPHTWGQAKEWIKVLQIAHLFIVLLSTGGRISEVLSLGAGCLVESADGLYTVQGRTYKLVFQSEGELRDWPLPDLGMKSIQQQEQLSAALTLIGAMRQPGFGRISPAVSIWSRVGAKGAEFDSGYNYAMRRTMAVLGLDELPGEGRLSAHRFRKTIARLAALSIVGAPKILMDLFGHKSIEMTLYYILTDPLIRAEMMEVAKAQTIMLAENAIRNADCNGGPAAERIQHAVAVERIRLGSDFGEEEIRSLAETFTFSGKTWQLVRPGVICTKLPQQSGPCSKRVGAPETSRCRSYCVHRLEDAALRDDVDRAIAEALQYLLDAESNDDPISAEMWAGQILANLNRFRALCDKWKEQPRIQQLLAEYPGAS